MLAIGGVPGTHEVSAWELYFPALPAVRMGDYETARRILEEALAENDHEALHYNLACVEALAGNRDRALDELERSAQRHREHARDDPDFDSLRDDPRFLALTGQPDPGGA